MYEVFPIGVGVVIALLVMRFVSERQRKIAYVVLGVFTALAATIIAGEEWFFIFVDLAEVFLAIYVTNLVVARWQERQVTRLS